MANACPTVSFGGLAPVARGFRRRPCRSGARHREPKEEIGSGEASPWRMHPHLGIGPMASTVSGRSLTMITDMGRL